MKNNKLKDRRVINIPKSDYDVMKDYCDKNTLDLPKWMVKNSLNKIDVDSKIKDGNRILEVKFSESGNHIPLSKLFYKILDINFIITQTIDDLLTTGNSYFKVNVSTKGVESVDYLNNSGIKRDNDKLNFIDEKNEQLQGFQVLHFRHLCDVNVLPYGVPINYKEYDNSIREKRNVHRITNIINNELNKLATIHLYSLGFRDTHLVEFMLDLNETQIKAIIDNYFISKECKR